MRTLASAVALAALLALGACGEGEGTTQGKPAFAKTPERSADGKEVYYFEDLATMTATSDIVVRGRVTKIAPGRSMGESDAERIYLRNISIDVLENVKGAAGAERLVFEEEGYDSTGAGYVLNGVQWSEVGDEAWYFFENGQSGPPHVICSYGRYTLSGRHRGPSGHVPESDGPWRRLVGKNSEAEIAGLIRASTKAANR